MVAEICADTGDTWVRVEIDGDADLVERFTEQVPVTSSTASSTTSGESTNALRTSR